MRNLIFILLILIPVGCFAQGEWTERQDFLSGAQLGDDSGASGIATIDSMVFTGVNIGVWSNGVKYNFLEGLLTKPAIITGTDDNYINIKMQGDDDRSAKFIWGADGLSMKAYSDDDWTQDSSYVLVDSNRVTIAVHKGAAGKGFILDTSILGILMYDNIEGGGLVFSDDYSPIYTNRHATDLEYQMTHLGNQLLDATVYSPGTANHGWILMYDSTGHYNGTDSYKLEETIPITSTTRVGLRAMDTILFSRTTADTIVILPVATVIDKILVYIGTAFDGSGTNLLDVGISTDGDKYENDLDLEDDEFDFYELANLPDRTASSVYVTYQYTDSGADAAHGFAIVYVYYTIF